MIVSLIRVGKEITFIPLFLFTVQYVGIERKNYLPLNFRWIRNDVWEIVYVRVSSSFCISAIPESLINSQTGTTFGISFLPLFVCDKTLLCKSFTIAVFSTISWIRARTSSTCINVICSVYCRYESVIFEQWLNYIRTRMNTYFVQYFL